MVKKSGKYIPCLNCGKKFYIYKCYIKSKRKKFCSKECRIKFYRNGKYINCSFCNKKFYIQKGFIKSTKKFCSKECHYNFVRLNRPLIICKMCKKEFYVTPNRKEKAIYCSTKCRDSDKEFVEHQLKPLRKYYSNNPVWNKGKKGLVKSNRKGKTNEEFYGKKQAEEIKKRISKGCKKSIGWIKGRTLKEVYGNKKAKEIKMKIGLKNKEHRKYQIFPKKDSSIEVKIQNFLKQLGIDYFTHQYMKIEHGYQCDIFIPLMNLVIECDGDYWHSYPIGREIDHIRTSELLKKGFKVLRLWEFEIKVMSLNEFKEKVNIYKLY